METLMRDVLSAWRHAECAVDECEPNTDEYEEALAAEKQLHALYQKLLWLGLTEATRREARETLAGLRLPELDEAAWAAKC
jgi:hypothetical protein